MGGDGSPGQDPGCGVDKGARAHAGEQRHGGALFADPVQVLGVAHEGSGALTAGVDEHVERRNIGERVLEARRPLTLEDQVACAVPTHAQ